MTEALHPWLQGFLARIEQGALPTPHWPIMTALGPCRKILLVDERRRRGPLSEELFTLLHEARPGYARSSVLRPKTVLFRLALRPIRCCHPKRKLAVRCSSY
ncbi:hypothetical protein [Alishewanella longhuensis]